MSDIIPCSLAPSAIVEPLINQWWAFPYLISPLPASLYLRYQLDCLKSFVVDAEEHRDASSDPDLIGGSIVRIDPAQVPRVQELIQNMENSERDRLALANAAVEFQNWLTSSAKGESMEALYAKVPSVLRGYVELVYDYYHRASVRFIEPALYASNYYKPNLQSLRLFLLRRDCERPFAISTPRLDEEDSVVCRATFDQDCVDELFRTDTCPQPVGFIAELLGLTTLERSRLTGLLLPPVRPAIADLR